MLKDTEYLRTFRFYNHKNHRLSIFGKFFPKTSILRIWILTTSSVKDKETKTPLDTFSKKEANRLIEDYLSYREGDEISDCKPIIFSIPCTDINYKKQFVQFCRENFFIKEELMIGLVDSNKMILVDLYSNSIKKIAHPDVSSLRIKNKPENYITQEQSEEMFEDEIMKSFQSLLRSPGFPTEDSENTKNN